MSELVFKYDVMYVYDDRYEFKRIKKKPFFKILSDIFLSKTSYAFLIIPVYMLIMYPITGEIETRHIPPVIFVFLFFAITRYYEQHKKNVTVLISDIQELCISKDKKTMRLEYKDNDNERYRLKIVDMPDTNSARQNIVSQLNKIHAFVD
jgi:hypothetical protein